MKKKTGKVLKKSFLPIILMVGIAAVSACRSEENRALEAALNPYRILSMSDEKRSVFLSETEEKITAAAESSSVPAENNTEAFWRIAAGYGYLAAGEFETALQSRLPLKLSSRRLRVKKRCCLKRRFITTTEHWS